jgi:hypothetical protein
MDKKDLETLLVAEVLILAQLIEAREDKDGHKSTGHFIPEAVREISTKKNQILELLHKAQ